MTSPIETAMTALFTKLTTVALANGFVTTSRRVIHWTQCNDQPALFLRRVGVMDEVDHDSGLPMTTIECEVWIYCDAGADPNVAADATLTTLEWAIRSAFVPDGDPGDTLCTLGGAVYWARVEGHSDISAGDQGPQAIARIPVHVTLLPSAVSLG